MLRRSFFPPALPTGAIAAASLFAAACALDGPADPDEPFPPVTGLADVSACSFAPPNYPDPVVEDPDPMQENNDLTIRWISRLPEIDYVWGSSDPAREGWPSPGESVTWRAHVKNWASTPKEDVTFEWRLDGNVVSAGTVDIPAEAYVTVDFAWIWEFDRHELEFVLDPQQSAGNRLLTYTDAITFGFYVEQGMYDHFHEHQHELGIGSNSFEGWAQRQVRIWNKMFEQAVYPETPLGVLDRVRIQEIVVQPDGTIRNEPVEDRRSVDLRWWVPFEFNIGPYNIHNRYQDYGRAEINNPFFYDEVLFHEIGHRRYLADVYRFDIDPEDLGHRIDIQEAGSPVAGSRFMPYIRPGQVFDAPEVGLMNHQYYYLDRHSAVALNLISGHRATMGNGGSSLGNFGRYLLDLPAQNLLTVRDELGRPLPRAKVAIFRHFTGIHEGASYGKYFDDVVDLEYEANDNGQVLVGRDPFALEDYYAEESYPEEMTLILRVEHAAGVGYGFLPAYLFNLEYWRGNTEQGEYDMCVSLIP